MSMNDTPRSERVHIAFFGRRNAGKSSVVNAVTSQQVSIVSDVRGTTTDPVSKSMELLPLGPVVVIDTPGFDDEGTLGQMRVQREQRRKPAHFRFRKKMSGASRLRLKDKAGPGGKAADSEKSAGLIRG